MFYVKSHLDECTTLLTEITDNCRVESASG